LPQNDRKLNPYIHGSPKMSPFKLENRIIIKVSGEDRIAFLQGLVTNDVSQLSPMYSALLTPQGKYLFDFFIIPQPDHLLIDCEESKSQQLISKLKLYKLRSKVELSIDDTHDIVLSDTPIEALISYLDPRDTRLGYRIIMPSPSSYSPDSDQYLNLRLEYCIPEGDTDLFQDKSIPMECRLDDLHGINWTKGCYMGQELTARTKYRGLVRKSLVSVSVDGSLNGEKIIYFEDKEVGDLRSHNSSLGIAYLRLEYITSPLKVGNAILKVRQLDSSLG
jgi:tRNA-modifying protein YgfZ